MNQVNDCSFGQKNCLLWQLTGFKTQWCDWGTLLTFDFPTPESARRYPPPWQWSISFAAIFWFHMQPTLKLTRSGQHPVLVRLQEDTLRQCQDHDPAHHLSISQSTWIEAILEWSWSSHKAIPENFCIRAMWLLKLQCLFLQLAVRCVWRWETCNNMTYVVPWVAAWWVRPPPSLRTEISRCDPIFEPTNSTEVPGVPKTTIRKHPRFFRHGKIRSKSAISPNLFIGPKPWL